MTELEKAKSLLVDDVTCVVVKGDMVLTSEKKGISPILDWIKQNQDLKDSYFADKIVGKAVAMLLVKKGVKSVYAQTVSQSGKQYLEQYNIKVTYDKIVSYIINRTKTDICPMEKTVKDVDDYEEGFVLLEKKVQELRTGK